MKRITNENFNKNIIYRIGYIYNENKTKRGWEIYCYLVKIFDTNDLTETKYKFKIIFSKEYGGFSRFSGLYYTPTKNFNSRLSPIKVYEIGHKHNHPEYFL